MCGIGGIVQKFSGHNSKLLKMKAMSQTLRHRGPDDEGFVFLSTVSGEFHQYLGADSAKGLELPLLLDSDPIFENANIGLLHRRLSIQDLSLLGHQPYHDERSQVWLTYNGEIFNFKEIKLELEMLGHIFRSTSDTEVVLKSYLEWGVDCVQKFNGMWAFCIIDLRSGRMFASRDRFGIKPFYYAHLNDTFVFASEPKALVKTGLIEPMVNAQTASEFLKNGILDVSRETFFSDLYQLRGGENLEFDLNENKILRIWRYWDIDPDQHSHLDAQARAHQFKELLSSSISLRLGADVPTGALLSGGLDSSAIVCIANKVLHQKSMPTFSARYSDERHDESEFIDSVLCEVQSEPHAIYPSQENLERDIRQLVFYQDEPFGSLSIFAQWNVFKAIGEIGIKVVLDGQGADEQLGGYHSAFPIFIGGLVEKGFATSAIKELFYLKKNPGYLIFRTLIQACRIVGGTLIRKKKKFRNNSFEDYLYKATVNPGLHSLLRFEDRNSMAFSIESRLPFLDHRLVEFNFAVPVTDKIHRGFTKSILRESLNGILPEKIKERKSKIGFSVPQDLWLRSEASTFINKWVAPQDAPARHYMQRDELIENWISEHSSGKKDHSSSLWRVASFNLWHQEYISTFSKQEFEI